MSSSAGVIAVPRLDDRDPLGGAGELRADRRRMPRPPCSDFGLHGLERPADRRQVALEPVELVGEAQAEDGDEPVAGHHGSRRSVDVPTPRRSSPAGSPPEDAAVDDEPSRAAEASAVGGGSRRGPARPPRPPVPGRAAPAGTGRPSRASDVPVRMRSPTQKCSPGPASRPARRRPPRSCGSGRSRARSARARRRNAPG